VESNLFSLNLAIFHIDLVSNQNNWDVFTNTSQILVPFWDICVGDSGADIEHDNTSVTSDVITITKTAKFLLSRGVPDIEFNLTVVCEERHRVDLDSKSGNILLFELSGKMTFDEGCFSNTTVSYKDELEFRDCLRLFDHLLF
jgi:hypothetical protein